MKRQIVKRHIELGGCNNFRDLGGYPARDGLRLRWRTTFRSDGLHLLTPAGVRRFVDELGIGAIVDLRSTAELAGDGRGPLQREDVLYHHLPMFDGAVTERAADTQSYSLADRYFLMAEYAKGPIAAVITALAETSSPIVYHCAAGKDRTGVISAIVLALLGVRESIIVADYAATQKNLDAIVDRLMSSDSYREMLQQLPPDTMHAEPDTMISLLENLKSKYGSVSGYARDIGISDAIRERLDRRMLEPAED